MNKHAAHVRLESGMLRAGVISSLVLTLCYLFATGISSTPRMLVFIISFAVSFVLIMSSVVDLAVWVFALSARSSGMGLGHAVRLLRRIL